MNILEGQGQGRIYCLVLPSTLMDVSVSNKSISSNTQFCVSSWGIKLGNQLSENHCGSETVLRKYNYI